MITLWLLYYISFKDILGLLTLKSEFGELRSIVSFGISVVVAVRTQDVLIGHAVLFIPGCALNFFAE